MALTLVTKKLNFSAEGVPLPPLPLLPAAAPPLPDMPPLLVVLPPPPAP
jgi:hypothetical protein